MVQLKRVAQGMNLQIIMANHEEALMPFADTVVTLKGRNAATEAAE